MEKEHNTAAAALFREMELLARSYRRTAAEIKNFTFEADGNIERKFRIHDQEEIAGYLESFIEFYKGKI